MRVVLKGGPLDGQVENLDDMARSFNTRSDGQHVAYDETGETDPATGLTIFAYRLPKPAAKGPADGQ